MRPIRTSTKTLINPEDMDLSQYSIPDSSQNPAAFERYMKIKSIAEDTLKEFTLSFEEFLELSSSDCHYCGIRPHQVWLKFPDGRFDLWYRLPPKPKWATGKIYAFICNGIDRRDGDFGYITENCVSCCYYCNVMKGAYSEDFFLDRITAIYEKCVKNSQINNDPTSYSE